MSKTCIVVGAGISGLFAGHELHQHGIKVILLDKGYRPGGRMATRSIRQGKADYGAQTLAAHTPEFQNVLDAWCEAGLLREWPVDAGNNGATYCAPGGMKSIPAWLSQGLDVRTRHQVTAVQALNKSWSVQTENGPVLEADSLMMTAPAPQSLRLLKNGGTRLAAAVEDVLEGIDYEPCLAVVASLNETSHIPDPGAVKLHSGPVVWIADNRRKGISPGAPTVTILGSPSFSAAHFEADPAKNRQILLDAAAKWIGVDIQEVHLHRWLYSQATSVHSEPYIFVPNPAPLFFAGDAFGRSQIEGAVLSGLAAARQLLELWDT